MSTAPSPLVLLRRLVDMGAVLGESRSTTMSDAAIRELRDHTNFYAIRPCEDVRLIGTEAVCLVECLAELTYARADKNVDREGRMVTLVNALRGYLHSDLVRAEKAAMQ